MKVSIILTFGAGIVAALDSTNTQSPPRRRALAPSEFAGEFTARPAHKPEDAPAGYTTGIASTSRQQSGATLQVVPRHLLEPAMRHRRDAMTARQLRRQVHASDFYECSNAQPAPTEADCRVIVDQVSASNEDLIVAENSCLVFGFGTCQGFFCSLCTTLSTSTDFIGSQLDLVDGLCVSGGQAGTIVGEESPQWDAGFVRTGNGLPSYDVC
ncbi:hypothetical protein B0H63DRAFT_140454 [Podospora didyma]|uniref:Ecp2 effector protein domain-containing protein n=1 Tax=Podospora didyma TaxID=330526 RepID=A0AAE0NS81_9PEZI|nr:hypothetical protein B0H63DRAFT_140454 [Podospora didyma]